MLISLPPKKFIAPFRLLVSASSGVGKSVWILKLLKHRNVCVNEKFSKIYVFLPRSGKLDDRQYCDELREMIPNVKIFDNLEDLGSLEKYDIFRNPGEGEGHRLVIFEDLISVMSKSSSFLDVCLRKSHHMKISGQHTPNYNTPFTIFCARQKSSETLE